MTRQLQRMHVNNDPDSVLMAIADDGGVIIEDFISQELVQKLRAQLGEYAEGFAPGIAEGSLKSFFAGSKTKRFSGLCARAPAFAEVVDHDLLHIWAARVFNNDYWINTTQAMVVGPGSGAQFLHRDCGNWPIIHDLGPDGPEVLISIMLALSDFTAENGATQIVPGSHRWELGRNPEPDEVVQAVMPAGSALLYTGKVIHSAGANTTEDQWRFGINLGFCLGQVTPEEASTITVPWSIAHHFPERVKAMLGYYSIRTFDGGWPSLWTKDYRELRDQLDPPPQERFVTAGSARQLHVDA
mgnify:CR=1 FL=1